MRKQDKLRKKQAKMNIKKCQRKYRKAVQRATASGTASTYLNLGVLYVGLRSSVELEIVILDYIAKKYKKAGSNQRRLVNG
jgi:hypothetical protein